MAIEKARQYKPSTVRRLDTLSGNECAAPDCTNKLIARDEISIVSKICHIEAASPDGPRFNHDMSDDERRHFDNLILLCDECHRIIDNPDNAATYTVEVLKEWKRNHEGKRKYSALLQQPDILNLAINAISDFDFDAGSSDPEILKPFNPQEKIEFNSLKRNRPLIEEYSVFFHNINSIYSELESQGSFRKEKLLRNINMIYIRAKGRYILDSSNAIEMIQKNADNIFEDVENALLKLIDNAIIAKEDIIFAIPVILVDAFMRCKILENPSEYDY